jgi:hypothetical protein
MGQDREDGEDGGPDVTVDYGQQQPPAFRSEIRQAIRYEKGLVVKALMVLAVVTVIVILLTLYFA